LLMVGQKAAETLKSAKNQPDVCSLYGFYEARRV